ncbi:hypothetical protein J6590_071427 [Homalodisca vitripennis]|nr:hypothetical protein J6590_071427 [Homalodisca vitripennis]
MLAIPAVPIDLVCGKIQRKAVIKIQSVDCFEVYIHVGDPCCTYRSGMWQAESVKQSLKTSQVTVLRYIFMLAIPAVPIDLIWYVASRQRNAVIKNQSGDCFEYIFMLAIPAVPIDLIWYVASRQRNAVIKTSQVTVLRYIFMLVIPAVPIWYVASRQRNAVIKNQSGRIVGYFRGDYENEVLNVKGFQKPRTRKGSMEEAWLLQRAEELIESGMFQISRRSLRLPGGMAL